MRVTLKQRMGLGCSRIALRFAVLQAAFQFILPSLGELPLTRLDSIFPPGGMAGSTVEISVSGSDLDGAASLMFSRSRITAERLGDPPGLKAAKCRFRVNIPADTLPGPYDVRVMGRFGVSNPRVFQVSALIEEREKGGNKDFKSAHEISVNRIINGRADANSADYFRFFAQAGERLLIRCAAREIDSRMIPILFLYDEKGRELERNRLGLLLDFTVPSGGQYVLKLFDSIYGGGDDYFYRLSIRSGPHVDFVAPAAGHPGSAGSYTLIGRNLPNGRPSVFSDRGRLLDQLSVEIKLPDNPIGDRTINTAVLPSPSAVSVGGVDYRFLAKPADGTEALTNPVFVGLTQEPIVMEEEPNDAPDAANRISIPCDFSSRFYPENDRDWVAFDAEKGDVYWIEVISSRLGLPTNPFVLIQRVMPGDREEEEVADVKELYASDENIGGREFDTSSRDPVWKFSVKETGSYRIQVRDLFNQSEADARLAYRLVIRNERPDFRLTALSLAPDIEGRNEVMRWSPFLRKGDSIPVKVVAFRLDGFKGDIEVGTEDLPEGVTCEPNIIASGKTSASIMLTASETAAGWSGPLRIVGRARINGSEYVREAASGTVVWSVGDFNQEQVISRATRELIASVSNDEVAPVSIYPASNAVLENWIGGVMKVPLDVVRRGGFKGEIKLKASGDSRFDRVPEVSVRPESTNAAVQLSINDLKIPAGEHRFFLLGHTKGKYQRASPETIRKLKAAVESAKASAKEAETKAANLAKEAEKAGGDSIALFAESGKRANEEKEKVHDELKKAEEALKKAVPEDTTFTVYSPPIRIRIDESPVRLSLESGIREMEQGGKTVLRVKAHRLFDFVDSVRVDLSAPGELEGFSAKPIAIPKGKESGELVVQAAPDAEPGKYNLTIRAQIRANGKEAVTDLPIELTVNPSVN